MTRTAWTLAALADAAVSGVRPTRVEELVDHVGERFRVGFVEDSDGRRWVVRVPVDAVAAAQLEESGALTELLAGHVPFAVPRPAGAAALRDGRRAVVTPLIPGRCIDFSALLPGPGLTAHVARAIAAIHNVDRRLFEEAGVPAYEAEDCRRRRQADVDRGAATGLVPTGLLARWERMLDDVAWWRFAPTPVHGRLQEDHLLLDFESESDSSSGRIVGVTSWEDAQIADPAQDLAALLALCPAESTDTVMEAYAAARHEPPDPHLAQRASLLAELEYLTELLTARRVGDRTHLSQATQALRRLDDAVSAERPSGNRSGTSIDRLPVDFEPAPVGQDWYSAGRPAGPTATDSAHGTGQDAPADAGPDAAHAVERDGARGEQTVYRAGEAATPAPASATESPHDAPPSSSAAGATPAPDPSVDPELSVAPGSSAAPGASAGEADARPVTEPLDRAGLRGPGSGREYSGLESSDAAGASPAPRGLVGGPTDRDASAGAPGTPDASEGAAGEPSVPVGAQEAPDSAPAEPSPGVESASDRAVARAARASRAPGARPSS